MSHPAETEKDFQNAVVETAKVFGWEGIYHTFDSQRSEWGFVDLILCRPPRLLVVELKSLRGVLTGEQADCLEMFMACGVETWVFWPEDWDSGLIEKVLKREEV